MDYRTALTTQVGDYNLLYQMIIYFLTYLPGDPIHLYKLLSVVFDFSLAAGCYAFIRKLTDEKKALFGYALVLFLPTVWINSAVWGQCDSIYASFIIWGLYLLYCEKTNRAFVLFGLALAFKLQTVFIFPFIALFYFHGMMKKKRQIHLYHAVIMIGTVILTALPNLIAGRPITDLFTIYLKQTDEYAEITKNYPSVWNLLRLSYDTNKIWCIVLTGVLLLVLIAWFCREIEEFGAKQFLWSAFLLTYTCVLFLPAMHDRYGYLYEILAVLLAFTSGISWIAVAILQCLSLKTYMYFIYQSPLNLEFLSFLNVLLYGFMLYAFWRDLKGKPITCHLFDRLEHVEEVADEAVVAKRKISRSDVQIMLMLTGIFLLIGFMNLGQMKAPKTTAKLGTEAEQGYEVYVPLVEETYVQTLCIYPLMDGAANVQVYYAKDGGWEEAGEQTTLGGVFTWKQINIQNQTHELCIMFLDSEVEIGEIACVDGYGKVIPLLDNAKPSTLFDEQECIHGIPTGVESMIFDEVYHGRTAYEFLQGMDIYENTHPPLGKVIISLGITIFGMNPFGWRIMSLLFGAFCIPVIYLLAFRLTGKRALAILVGILQMTEFMHFTLSRIATIDIFVAFFVICLFYGIVAFLQEKKNRYLLFAGSALAFGVATKWTAVYAGMGVAIILFVWMIRQILQHESAGHMVRFVLVCLGSFVLIPAVVYVLSYIPFTKVYPDQNIVQHAISNSIHMLEYHKGVTESHPYASDWYTWLFDWIPLVDIRVQMGEYKSVIATFVNPLVCYLGLASVIHHMYLAYKKDKTAWFLLVFYFSMLVPWMFISRTVFIYQYFICTKVLILMICRSVLSLQFKQETKVIRVLEVASILLFVAYFPVISGVAANARYITEILNLLPKWWF